MKTKPLNLEKLLFQASHILNQDLELETLLKNILDMLTEFLEVEASAILLFGSSGSKAELYSFTPDKQLIKTVYDPQTEKGIASLVIVNKEPLIFNREDFSPELKEAIDQKLHINCTNLKKLRLVQEINM